MAEVDPLHQRLVSQALMNHEKDIEEGNEYACDLTVGEIFLFHCLLQDYALELLGGNQQLWISLLERNKARLTEGSE